MGQNREVKGHRVDGANRGVKGNRVYRYYHKSTSKFLDTSWSTSIENHIINSVVNAVIHI